MLNVIRRIGAMISHPTRAWSEIREERPRRSLAYLTILLLLDSLLLVVASLLLWPNLLAPMLGPHPQLGWLAIALMVPLVIGAGIFMIGLFSLVLHLFVLLLGGRRGLGQTLKATAYGSTPLVLTAWFPPLIPITWVWSLVLTAIGVRKLQDVSPVKAVLAVVLPVVVLGVVAWVVRG